MDSVQSPPPAEPQPNVDTEYISFQIVNQVIKLASNESIPIINKNDYEENHVVQSNQKLELSQSEGFVKFPEPRFSIITNGYPLSPMPTISSEYIKYIEKNDEELDAVVEYDMDEEDLAWLNLFNAQRHEQNLSSVSEDIFELLMDRFEKESYYHMRRNGQNGGVMIDEEAICWICMDDDGDDTNVLLFCDLCNSAVHQVCYGVPYIPEGQWFCRSCSLSPSQSVECVLCPNYGGVLKQTDTGLWAHVVCALWIPEVRFLNTVFMEPIASIEKIGRARLTLRCYLCKKRGVGACIKCYRTNCNLAFHVTCAQAAGLYMKIQEFNDTHTVNSNCDGIEKLAFCESHSPLNAEDRPNLIVYKKNKKKKFPTPIKPTPTVPLEKIQEIGSLVSVERKGHFILRLIAYWTVKRKLRNGLPLLRRLQTTHTKKKIINYNNKECHQEKYNHNSVTAGMDASNLEIQPLNSHNRTIKKLTAHTKRAEDDSHGDKAGTREVSNGENPSSMLFTGDTSESPIATRRSEAIYREDQNPDKKISAKQRQKLEINLKLLKKVGSDDGLSSSERPTGSINRFNAGTDRLPNEKLNQLQLVWAKCHGYASFPARIIDPKMANGYVHEGDPLPSPPADVIAMAKNHTEHMYLVLFFDKTRTWQWLPRNKLEPMGVNPEVDDAKLISSRKPHERKSVKQAYLQAMKHHIK